MTKEYPEWFSSRDDVVDELEFHHVDVGSYKDDFEAADKLASQIGGVVYTAIDGEGQDIIYEKGTHYVNRIGVYVLKRLDK